MFLFTPVVDLIKIADLTIFARIILLYFSYLIMASSPTKSLGEGLSLIIPEEDSPF